MMEDFTAAVVAAMVVAIMAMVDNPAVEDTALGVATDLPTGGMDIMAGTGIVVAMGAGIIRVTAMVDIPAIRWVTGLAATCSGMADIIRTATIRTAPIGTLTIRSTTTIAIEGRGASVLARHVARSTRCTQK